MHRKASQAAIAAAIAAYNTVWEAAQNIDAKTVDKIRLEAMTAALNAAVPYIDPFIDGYLRQSIEVKNKINEGE